MASATDVGINIAINSAGAQQGAQQVTESLNKVTDAAKKTTTEITNVEQKTKATGDAMGKMTSSTSSFIGISGGISQIGYNMGALAAGTGRVDTALITAGRAMLDFQRIGQDVRIMQAEMSAQTGRAAGVWSTLGMAIKANPILTIATVIAAAGAAMSFFAGKTNEAADAQRKLAESIKALKQTQAVLDVRARMNDPTLSPNDRIAGNIDQLHQFLANPQAIERADLEAMLGAAQQMTPQDFVWKSDIGQGNLFSGKGTTYAPTTQVTPQAAQRLAERRLAWLYGIREYNTANQARESKMPSSISGPDVTLGKQSPIPGQDVSLSLITAQREAEQLSDQLRGMEEVGRGVGYAIADGFDRAIQSGGNLRSMLTGILQDLGRMFTQMAGTGLANALGKAFAATPSQSFDGGAGYGNPLDNFSPSSPISARP